MTVQRAKQNLKTGFTTGTAAAAAAKGALFLLLSGEQAEKVRVSLLSEGSLKIPVRSCSVLSRCASEGIVVKDAGDDPDVTHGAEIGVRVWIEEPEDRCQKSEVRCQMSEGGGLKTEDGGMQGCWLAGMEGRPEKAEFVDKKEEKKELSPGGEDQGVPRDVRVEADRSRESEAIEIPLAVAGTRVRIVRGKGVGVVTKPGLEVSPGHPAVTSGPQAMIARGVQDVLDQTGVACSVGVEIFVPRGEDLARKTLNPRLGILGGISILGTTGVVHPLSHESYQASIKAGIQVARAAGLETIVLTTGRRSERNAQALLPELPEEAFIQMGDFFKYALQAAADLQVQGVILAVFWGKAVKMAQGFAHTHAAASKLSLQRLAEWAQALSKNRQLVEEIQEANTARQTFPTIFSQCPELIKEVERRIREVALGFADHRLEVRVLIFDFEGHPVCQD